MYLSTYRFLIRKDYETCCANMRIEGSVVHNLNHEIAAHVPWLALILGRPESPRADRASLCERMFRDDRDLRRSKRPRYFSRYSLYTTRSSTTRLRSVRTLTPTRRDAVTKHTTGSDPMPARSPGPRNGHAHRLDFTLSCASLLVYR